jgi:hypothetical protein
VDPATLQSSACAFNVLDLRAELQFASPGSASFDLGTDGPLRLSASADPDMDVLNRIVDDLNIPAFHIVGWLDVHHPCDGHIKARLRVNLPAEYGRRLTHEARLSVVRDVFAAVGIPQDETYEASFFSGDDEMRIDQPVDRHGVSDRI